MVDDTTLECSRFVGDSRHEVALPLSLEFFLETIGE